MALVETCAAVRAWLDFAWNGPVDLPRFLRVEWRLVAVRWLGIASLAPALLLAHLPSEELVAAYLQLAAATVYNAGLLLRLTAALAANLQRQALQADTLQRAYSDLATAHQDLLSVDEMKTNFLANVSHELRTPLTSIRSFSELLLSYEEDPATQKEFLRIINNESERLTRLVNDVLDISRIEAGHMNWQMASVDVTDLLDDLARTFGPLVTLAQLEFLVDVRPGLPRVHGDRDRLHQVFANLLNNAMKFTPPGGSIVLRAEAVDGHVRISVGDTGVGIAAQEHERIFEKFQQVGNALTGKPRGTGLGLPICRDIVEHHRGWMWVTSTPGVGSTFTVALPADVDVRRAA
jgi:signal transduction histidine kinase